MRTDRLISWFSESDYERLNDDDRNQLNRYRRRYSDILKREAKIKRALKLIEEDKAELREWNEQLTYLKGNVDHLRSDYMFTLSVVNYKKRDIRYYNLTLKRQGKSSKSIYLGREETIREHLSKYFNNDKYLNSKTDWVGDLKVSGQMDDGELRINILNLILDDPYEFDAKKVTLNDVLPLN